jgi:hypothetical protein
MRVRRSSASLAALVQRSGLKMASNMIHGCPARECEIMSSKLIMLTLVGSVTALAEDDRKMIVGRGNSRVVTYVDE